MPSDEERLNTTLLRPNGITAREWADQLIHRFGPMVYRRALTILGDADDAKDVTQEVFLTLLRNAAEVEHEACSWLYRVTTNACLNRLRAKRRYDAMRARNTLAEPANDTLDEQRMARQLLSEGDPECAAAALYVYVEGMSQEEAAEVLGVSRRTVGYRLERFVRWAHSRIEPGDELGSILQAKGGRP